MTLLQLPDQLAFYGAYHNNKWNQIIHLIFVPAIFASFAVLFCYTDALAEWPALLRSNIPSVIFKEVHLNLALLVYLGYIAFYLILDPFGSVRGCTSTSFLYFNLDFVFVQVLANIILTLCVWAANVFYNRIGREMAWQYAAVVNIFSWYMQIHVGHMICEGRKPALLDSFFQSLVLAPLFVSYEVLFFFGFRRGLYNEVQGRVSRNLFEARRNNRRKIE